MNPNMHAQLGAQQTLSVGTATKIRNIHPRTGHGVMFEDEGETGYFYALDPARGADDEIVDALHIYNVEGVVDRKQASILLIVWSHDGLKSALLINGFVQAIIDFQGKRGYCRSGYPPSNPLWSKFDHKWTDSAFQLFAGPAAPAAPPEAP